jgi:hypothetical protein
MQPRGAAAGGAGMSGDFLKPDASHIADADLLQLNAYGGSEIQAFSQAKDDNGTCVVLGRRGFGKSHLLGLRSLMHRSREDARRTLFYPSKGRDRPPADRFTDLYAQVPRWLEARDASHDWMHVWQLAVYGLMAWLTECDLAGLKAYADWFPQLAELGEKRARNRQRRRSGALNELDQHQGSVQLSWFIQSVLERLSGSSAEEGRQLLASALHQASSNWEVVILHALRGGNWAKLAIYLDGSDELVSIQRLALWRNVQQGLLIAIHKFRKHSAWQPVLRIYATMRSEAIDQSNDHADISLAQSLTLTLSYTADHIRDLIFDRIRRSPTEQLSIAIDEDAGVNPLHALCGFNSVSHADRKAPNGHAYVETIADALLRHTRLVPREAVALVGAIHGIPLPRSFEDIRESINDQARINLQDAITSGLPGWDHNVQPRLAELIDREVVPRQLLFTWLKQLNVEADAAVREITFLVRTGLLGTGDSTTDHHRHYYRQNFRYHHLRSFGVNQLYETSYFFVHPCFREWIVNQDGWYGSRFECMKVGVVGDGLPYERAQPLLRLGEVDGKAAFFIKSTSRSPYHVKMAETRTEILLFAILVLSHRMKGRQLKFSDLEAYTSSSACPVELRYDWRAGEMTPLEKCRDAAKVMTELVNSGFLGAFYQPAAIGSKAKGRLGEVRSSTFLAVRKLPNRRLAAINTEDARLVLPELRLDEMDIDEELRSFRLPRQ